MNLVQCRYKEFMSVLLRVAGKFSGKTPGSGKESDRPIWSSVARIDLKVEAISALFRRGKSLTLLR